MLERGDTLIKGMKKKVDRARKIKGETRKKERYKREHEKEGAKGKQKRK